LDKISLHHYCFFVDEVKMKFKCCFLNEGSIGLASGNTYKIVNGVIDIKDDDEKHINNDNRFVKIIDTNNEIISNKTKSKRKINKLLRKKL